MKQEKPRFEFIEPIEYIIAVNLIDKLVYALGNVKKDDPQEAENLKRTIEAFKWASEAIENFLNNTVEKHGQGSFETAHRFFLEEITRLYGFKTFKADDGRDFRIHPDHSIEDFEEKERRRIEGHYEKPEVSEEDNEKI